MAQNIELAVGVVELKRDGAHGLGRGTTNLGNFEFNAVRNIDAHAMLLAGRGTDDGAASRFKDAWNRDACAPFRDIDFEGDRLEERVVNRAGHGVIHPPMSHGPFRLAAIQHGQQRLALPLVGTLIDNGLQCAIAFEDRSRPRIEECKTQAIESDVAKMPAIDAADFEAAAIAVCRKTFELARAAVIAIAASEQNAIDAPVDHRVLALNGTHVPSALEPCTRRRLITNALFARALRPEDAI